MNKMHLLSALLLLASAGCQPDELVDVIVPGDECGSSGARVEATIDGSDWCANASVLAIGDGGTVMITGINALGTTLVLQVDSIGLGPQPITEASNALMYLSLGLPYTPLNSDPGQLIIATLDTAARRITGAFEVTLHADGGGSRPVSGAFDVQYTQQ
jgi:hypothetical protein